MLFVMRQKPNGFFTVKNACCSDLTLGCIICPLIYHFYVILQKGNPSLCQTVLSGATWVKPQETRGRATEEKGLCNTRNRTRIKQKGAF